jgi:hypothetical protein
MSDDHKTAGNGEAVVPVIEDKLDPKLVDDAVVWLNQKAIDTLTRGMTEIGEYILDKFYNNDPALARSRGPKMASFRALVDRCETRELRLSKSTLNNAVGLVLMLRTLPAGATAFTELGPSQQLALLPVRNPTIAEQLAVEATSRHLSVRQLKKMVAEERKKLKEAQRKRPRKVKPLFVKALAILEKRFIQNNGLAFTEPQIKGMRIADAAKSVVRVNGLVGILNKLLEALKPRSEEKEEPRKVTKGKGKGAKPKSSKAAAQSKAAPENTCSKPRCGKNWYMPSGKAKKLCYKHFIAAGGKAPSGPKKKAKGQTRPQPVVPRRKPTKKS